MTSFQQEQMNDTTGQSREQDLPPVLPEDVPVTMPNLPPKRTINTLQQFRAISDPMRSKILGIIQTQPATAKQLAERLGSTPGAVGHHLHVLEEAGLAQIVARRTVRGIIANYYTRTARLFVYELPPDVVGEVPVGMNIFSVARDEIVEVLALPEKSLFYQGLPHARLSEQRARHYAERLQALVDELLSEPPDPQGNVYGMYLVLYEAPDYLQNASLQNASLQNASLQNASLQNASLSLEEPPAPATKSEHRAEAKSGRTAKGRAVKGSKTKQSNRK
jgi:DNA-binding transcriptional ArsR family regulator